METTNANFTATHKTKYGFGGLLPAGIRVNILKDIVDNRCCVIDHCGNTWHGSKNDLEPVLIPFSKRTAESIYLEFVNDWLTIKSMADNYNMHAQDLGHIIDKGRDEHIVNIAHKKLAS